MSDRQRNVFILLLVAGLIAASGAIIASRATFLGLDLRGGVELVYEGIPTPQSGVTPASLDRTVAIMRSRVDQLGVSEPSISTVSNSEIDVQLPDVHDVAQAEAEVGQTANLSFFDWEANVLTPNGDTVASQLQAQDPTAVAISRDAGSSGSLGSSPGGSTDLYSAITLAESVTHTPIGKFNTHAFPIDYLFAAPGSHACQLAARQYHYTPVAGVHCYLAGPISGPPSSRPIQTLDAGLPAGITPAQAELKAIPRGVIVLAAVPADPSHPANLTSPTTGFYTLLDRVSLLGTQITNPQASSDASGEPDVTFGLTSAGANQFGALTARIAHRGELDSGVGGQLYQHFAVALDNRLITVPYINFNLFQDGIIGNSSEISGNFSITSAQNLATQLRLGALPINLKLISTQQVSASLGKQALNQGLLAGALGLAIVVLFLLFYYRILGLIATAALGVYSLYFYGLIKLIPITMTLSGIAGLILTIGVAADANIVIFERVKEEIRAGRSVRAGIAIGYRKGLTAIIDANVVTIMTAFILFVLATSDVKGFAFTLGIGTIVSLFTAVMATQAILMTTSGAPVMRSPSALGAGGKKRAWSYDFMGASKYFFSLSGCILLIGALAIGGRGLNLGIDFTSGTQISVGLARPATQQQVTNVMTSVGVKNSQIQKVNGDSSLGKYGFQIDSNKLPSTQTIENALQNKFGISRGNGQVRYNVTSVGPTFGKTVANSAIEAIIASLLVISLYIALRFEWKFAVPVLIALMHDLLITSGVYALTGRTVGAATVAALLTILGYSLYDTIIVFDRVRENIPRMPRAAFSQIVNRSMSEVLTRSIATTSCTLLPVIALLLFGGATLKDFAFALLIGVASGAYSSIFIASPVLTHWKEREHAYRARRHRIEQDLGHVPAYASAGADIEPQREVVRRTGRLTRPDDENVSAAEFEQMKRDLEIEPKPTKGRTSRLTSRLSRTDEDELTSDLAGEDPDGRAKRPLPQRPAAQKQGLPQKPAPKPGTPARAAKPAAPRQQPVAPQPKPTDALEPEPTNGALDGDEHSSAPDVAENEGMVTAPKPKIPAKRNRRHGRR